MGPPCTPIPTEGSDESDQEKLPPAALPANTQHPYQYEPLPPSAIRLLHLLPDDDKSKPIRCELLEFHLDKHDHQPSLYETLSYTWGNPERSCVIAIQNNTIAITANLHAALVRLRHYSLPRILWVDAICIDQDNDKEKATQIPLMYSIYSHASSVLVWLGEAPQESDQVFDDLCVLASKRAASPDYEEKVLSEEIYRLLRHDWFQRVWVLQEVAAARHIQILRGHSGIDGYAFCLAMDSLLNSSSSDKWYRQLRSTVRPVTHLMRRSIFRPKCQSSATASHGIYRLGELVDMFHGHQASISSDKIYALNGMSCDGSNQPSLTPNYSIPFHEVFEKLVRYLVPAHVSVIIQKDEAAAVIRGKGRFVGYISHVNPIITGNQQHLKVQWGRSVPRGWAHDWQILAPAVPLEENDLVYLLHGTSTPLILRMCGNVAVVLTTATFLLLDTTNVPEGLYEKHQRSLTMIWDWEYSPDDLDRVQSYDLWTRARCREPISSEADLHDVLDDLHQLADLALDICEDKPSKMAVDLFSSWIQRCNAHFNSTGTQVSTTNLNSVLQDQIRDVLLQAPEEIHQRLVLWAYAQRHQALFSFLLRMKLVVSSEKAYDEITLLAVAIYRGDKAVIEELLRQEQLDINATFELANGQHWTGLELAAAFGYMGMVELFLDRNADVDARSGWGGKSALYSAAEKGHLAVVERLLLANADVNIRNGCIYTTALHSAASGGHLAVVERLLLANADVNAKDAGRRTALRLAASRGHPTIVERLLLANVDVHVKDSWGRTALQKAASRGHLAIVERLLLANADVNAADLEGRTSLLDAALRGHLAVVERLLLTNADIHTADSNGKTLLHSAVIGGSVAIVERLLLTNAEDIHAVDSKGETALHLAASRGHLAIVDRLLLANANIFAVDSRGNTVLQKAEENDHSDVIERLELEINMRRGKWHTPLMNR